MSEILWHNLPEKEIFELLKTSDSGLDEPEAERRLKKFGLNKLPEEKKAAWFFILFNQFKSPLIYILLLAALISFFLQEMIDMVVILAAVAINTIVGFIQENKAEKTIEHLKKIVAYQGKILRAGQEIRIDSSQLAIGDILILEAGDRVPADGRIFQLNDFQVNEAALTGESLPVSKDLSVLEKGANLADRKNMVFMGTVVTRGRARVIVTATGIKTQLGEIALLVKGTAEEKTPLQLKMVKFSKILGSLVLAASLFIFIYGVIIGEDIFTMFETSVAIAVAAIPEGLIVSMTIILTVGMQRILRKKALVRKLIAAETLGSASVICTDKTGTLTEGNMRVDHLLTGRCDLTADIVKIDKRKISEMSDHYLLLAIGAVCNNAVISSSKTGLEDEFIGEPTEIALLKAGIESGLDYKALRTKAKRLAEIPFSTEIKYMATLNNYDNNNNIIYLKGAPEKILNFCSFAQINGEHKRLDDNLKNEILNNFNSLTSQGLRVLAAGYKLVEKNKISLAEEDLQELIFLGIFALKDPLRKEAHEAINLCKMAGIRPVIITGDHRLTVKTIAREVGLEVGDQNILEGEELDKLSDEELKKIVKDIIVYARVSPKHKLRIIDAWQANGEVVAMIGDGVNDAPALKSADIGVALGSGTDVAKEISDIILLDNNFKTIVEAVRQGRIIFDNIRKVITYLLSACFTEIILVSGALVARLPLPIIALQILYTNIITDGFPGIALTFEPGEKDLMAKKPRRKEEPILNREMKYLIFGISIFSDIVFFALFIYLLRLDYGLEHIRTIIFTVIALGSLLYIFSIKSLRKNIWQINIFNNRYLLAAVLFGLALQLFALYMPFMRAALSLTLLTSKEWLLIIGLSLIKFVAIEFGKFIFINKRVKIQS